jgi:hypothetical protein
LKLFSALPALFALVPGQFDLEVCLALTGYNPQIAVATQRRAEFHFHFVRPMRHVPDRILQRGDEARKRAKRRLELVAGDSGDVFGDADLRQAGSGFITKMDFAARADIFIPLAPDDRTGSSLYSFRDAGATFRRMWRIGRGGLRRDLPARLAHGDGRRQG